MATATAFYATGKVTAVKDGKVIFAPTGTNYELELVSPKYAGPTGKPVKAIIRVKARKVWTVPSGGNFITPIFGPPKIIQGRVRSLDARTLVIQAGTAITVDLPDEDIVFDLANGAISEGVMVNVTAFAGGTFELV
ncbi:hypothetical protein [Humisphaera borealis]|uniref:Uncharacterized protein n=1 Tax=Humisphaera borealis TaxID=2807512 RepID=A0A7M2WTY1_9BACT|nr:hypothetical protein [Humisphaera borealis]QOV88612.1 hypothetical protein IPV69_20575 [Humisphaera borealis]